MRRLYCKIKRDCKRWFAFSLTQLITFPFSFLSDVGRIAREEYVPTADDILRARLQTKGVEGRRRTSLKHFPSNAPLLEHHLQMETCT